MSFSSAFAQQPRSWIFAQMLVLVLIIGFFDFFTGYQISFFIFYGAPVFIVAWFCDKKSAILIALIAGITWWWADLQAGHPYLNNWIEGWETVVRLSFFVFVALVGSALRAQSEAATARIALLEHSQRLEREIIGISEREQRRIGQDLHDGLCQYLAALGCAAAALRGDLQKLKLPAETEVAGELAKLLQDAVVQTRDLARGLVPVPMDEDGLASALENLALSVTRLQGIDCTFETNEPSLGYRDSCAMHLYRIAQEAINNATKHGKARKITLSLNATENVTTLRIVDNGQGISKTARSSRGMGLNIMKYRARLSGGELNIEEPKEGGTIVSCTLRSEKPNGHENAA
ncbi:MAG: sensor histidine kinase [Verrucomicrobiota bacterium]|nr:sensor histidine kinase [Verrucomicrobiota bacterium]